MRNNFKLYKLHVDKTSYTPIATVKEEDNVTLNLELFKDNVPLALTDQIITLSGLRSDKVIIEQTDGFSIDDNRLTINLKNNITAKNGIVYLELTLTDNLGSMTTLDFYLKVNRKIFGHESIMGSDNIASLEQIKQEFKETLNKYKNDYESLKRIILEENQAANLQNQINVIDEEKATKTEVEVERKRIDLLTKIENGQTEGNTELLDIRIGIDGEIYDTAGTSVRKQIGNISYNLYDSMQVLNNNIYKATINNLIIGENAYAEGEGEDVIIRPQSNRARTGYISPIVNNIKYKPRDGFMVGYTIVGKDGKCVEDVGFRSTEVDVSIENGNKIIFRCKKTDDSNLAQDDIPFDLYYINESSINRLVEQTETIFNSDRLNEYIKIIYGENAHGIDSDKLIVVKQSNRARSEVFKPRFNMVVITPFEDYLVGYTIVDKDSNVILDVPFRETEQVVNVDPGYNLVVRCKKYNDSVIDKDTKVFNISYIGKISNRISELERKLERKQQNPITINLSYLYEKGSIRYDTGVIGDYSLGFKHSRINKFLKVVGGSSIKAMYTTVDKLYLYEYDKNKKFIIAKSLVTNSERKLNKETAFVKFQHDNYIDGEVLLTYCSPEINAVWEYNNRVNGNTIPFGYEVYPSYQTDVSDSVTELNTKKVYTSGLLMLPPNYSEYGEKVPVIYFSHGSGDYQSITNKEFSQYYMDYIRYLRDEGFAIFDCYGWTDLYTTVGCQMANPTNMSAIKQGLKWVCDNYNVDINRVYVTGKSLGGLQAINMCYERDFPIKACCPIAPEIDATSIGFGYEKGGRKSYAKDLGFSEDVNNVLEEEGAKLLSGFSANFKAYAKENAHKLQGYNPLWRNLLNANIEELIQYQIDGDHLVGLPNKIKTMTRICNTPTKIIVAIDDTAVSHDLCKAYLQSIKNGGGVGEIRSLPVGTGQHHAVDNDPNALKVESITTKCGVTHTNVPLAYAEMVQFFRRYM